MRVSLLILTLLLPACATSREQQVRIVSWNVLVGFQDHGVGDPWLAGEDRRAQAYAWLAQVKPDIVAWQELNGYTPEKLRQETRALEHCDAVLLKERGYDLGLSSRWPIEVVERHLDGMHHGLLHARTNGIDLFVVHLCPHEQDVRLREMKHIAPRVHSAIEDGRQVVVLGDFNACTTLDNELFGDVARRWYTGWKYPYTDDGFPDGRVLDAAYDAGLVDSWSRRRDPDTPAFRGRPRIDFILLSPSLDAQCTDAAWIDDPSLDLVTDHPPVLVELELPNALGRVSPSR